MIRGEHSRPVESSGPPRSAAEERRDRIRTAKNDRPCTTVMPAGVAKRLRAFVAGRTEGPRFLAGGYRVSMRHAQRRLTCWFRP